MSAEMSHLSDTQLKERFKELKAQVKILILSQRVLNNPNATEDLKHIAQTSIVAAKVELERLMVDWGAIQ